MGFNTAGTEFEFAFGNSSIPKFTFVWVNPFTTTLTIPFTKPSLPKLSQQSSPVFAQPAGIDGVIEPAAV